MGDKTGISWTNATWNPVRGCAPVSPGCANCYAARMASRFAGPGQPYQGLAFGGRWTGAARFVPEMLDLPFRWRKPRRVFVNSMSDLFHDDVTNDQIASVFGVMAACPQHTFQVLTKRPGRMAEWFQWAHNHGQPHTALHVAWCLLQVEARTHPLGDGGPIHCKYGPNPDATWPLPNVWLGVSVEDQARANERIPLLLQTPSAVRFVSAEPLLGAVDVSDYLRGYCPGCREHGDFNHGGRCEVERLDWVIVGGESGPLARPCSVEWVRSIVRQCRTEGVPVFVKQLGATPLMRQDSLDGRRAGDHPEREWPEGTRFGTSNGDQGTERQGLRVFLRDGHGGDVAEWPEDLRVRQWPGTPRATPEGDAP